VGRREWRQCKNLWCGPGIVLRVTNVARKETEGERKGESLTTTVALITEGKTLDSYR